MKGDIYFLRRNGYLCRWDENAIGPCGTLLTHSDDHWITHAARKDFLLDLDQPIQVGTSTMTLMYSFRFGCHMVVPLSFLKDHMENLRNPTIQLGA